MQPPASKEGGLRRRFRLRHLLFFALLLSGVVPLALSSLLQTRQTRDTFERQERASVAASAQALSDQLNSYLRGVRRQLTLIGGGILAGEGAAGAAERLRQPWVHGYLGHMMSERSGDLITLRVVTPGGEAIRPAGEALSAAVEEALDAASVSALEGREPVYRFSVVPPGDQPAVILAVPVGPEGAEPALIVEGLLRLSILTDVFRDEASTAPGVGLFLVARDGRLLWSRGITPEMQAGVDRTAVVRDFVNRPLSLTGQYTLTSDGRRQDFLVRVSPLEETGWGVLVQRPMAAAFEIVDRMAFNSLIFFLLLVAVALLVAVYFARRVSQPIQRLAETSHEIAAGNFGRRVEVGGLAAELADLGEDFNRMGDHVERYVAQLQQAARINRELFIGSLRAFSAAIDAKDPYTRGHSERVATLARATARHLGLPEEVQERVWIGALLHDVGKIGVDDRILKKVGVLTPEEYEQMKAHPVIGAEILAPIEQLREIIPAVRWHHEGWNGRGYPDGLRGESIPLIARIVAVADTFDAITTSRPYQEGYTTEFATQTITQLAGARFDAKIVTAFLSAYRRGEIQAARPGKVGFDRAADARVAAIH